MKWMAFAAVLLLASCVTPLAITDIKVADDCGCICLAWTTTQDAQCKLTYCDDRLCYTSPLEPEYDKLHQYSIPQRNAKDILITAIGRDGKAVSVGVRE